jgi:Tol biopolymer transport system component
MQLAYVTSDDRLALVRADGSEFRTIADRVASPPAWSPDGKGLAYTFDAGGNAWRVALVDAASASVRVLDRGGIGPSWSPNGRWLVDYTQPLRGRAQLHVVDTRTGRVRTVTHDASTVFGADDLQPSWSPDGTTIAFASANLSSPGATMQGGELRFVRPDGRAERRLTYHCAGADNGGSPNRINGSWLPDLVLARNGVRDDVVCGGGYDVVYAERRDRVRRDCESVRYAPSRPGT